MKAGLKMKTRRWNKKSGFSLLELLAVVTILGIIAAIIVPRVSVSTANANTQVRAHQIATLNAAMERYYVDTGAFPATLAEAAFVSGYVPEGVPTPAGGGTYTIGGNDRIVYTP